MDGGRSNIKAEAEPPKVEPPARSEPAIDRKVDPVALVDPQAIKAAPPALPPALDTVEPLTPKPQPLPLMWIALIIGGVIAALIAVMILNRHAHTPEDQDDEGEEIPTDEEEPTTQTRATAPAYGGALPGMI